MSGSVSHQGSQAVGHGAHEKLGGVTTEAADAAAWGQSFMRRLDPGDQLAFASLVRREHHAGGSVVFREGEPGEVLYIIWSGRVAIVKENRTGRPVLLAYRGPGEVVGEMGVMGGRSRSASVVAVDDCDLLAMRAGDFRRLIATHPAIAEALLQVLTDRLRAADVARTALLHQEQDAVRRADRLSKEIERLGELVRQRQEMVDFIVEDLCSPLLTVQSSLELLQAMLPEEVLVSAAGMLQAAQDSTGRVLALVEGLITTSHGEGTGNGLDPLPAFWPGL